MQWRATLTWPGQTASAVLVADGIVTGDAERLSRRDAISIANRRALWDLTYEIVATIADRTGVRQKLKHARGMERDYYARVDGWGR